VLVLTLFPRSDLNRIVMDYLVTEGYKAAADEFCKEANMAPPAGLERIDKRIVIRDAVQRGDIQEAIQQVNEFNPEVNQVLLSLSGLKRFMHHSQTLGSVMRLQTKTSVFNMTLAVSCPS
jgi:hypothetical protein